MPSSLSPMTTTDVCISYLTCFCEWISHGIIIIFTWKVAFSQNKTRRRKCRRWLVSSVCLDVSFFLIFTSCISYHLFPSLFLFSSIFFSGRFFKNHAYLLHYLHFPWLFIFCSKFLSLMLSVNFLERVNPKVKGFCVVSSRDISLKRNLKEEQ